MKKIVKASICVFLLLAIFMTSVAFASGNVIRIRTTSKGASLRCGPGLSYDKIKSIHANTVLDVLGMENGWYHVCYNGTYGYVTSGSKWVTVEAYEDNRSGWDDDGDVWSDGSSSRTATWIRTTKIGASLRCGPGLSYDKIASIHGNTLLEVLGTENGWYYVEYNGKNGYVTSGSQWVTVESWGETTDPWDNTEQPYAQTSSVARIRTNSQGASLRAFPSRDARKIASIHANTYLDVYGEENGWYSVYYNGKWGYIMAGTQHVTIVEWK